MSGEGLIAEPRAVHSSEGHARLAELMHRGTEFLGCEVAIMGGAMSWVSERNLVSAISVSSSSGVIAPQAITPKPPAFEMAETRLRSDTQLIAPPMIATSHPRNSVPRCINSFSRSWPAVGWTARGSAISPSPLMPLPPWNPAHRGRTRYEARERQARARLQR